MITGQLIFYLKNGKILALCGTIGLCSLACVPCLCHGDKAVRAEARRGKFSLKS